MSESTTLCAIISRWILMNFALEGGDDFKRYGACRVVAVYEVERRGKIVFGVVIEAPHATKEFASPFLFGWFESNPLLLESGLIDSKSIYECVDLSSALIYASGGTSDMRQDVVGGPIWLSLHIV